MTNELTDVNELPQLKFVAPRRQPPPTHLADLGLAKAQELCVEHGYPKFRAQQVAKHWYGRFESAPAAFTDLPATQRDEILQLLLPKLLTEVKQITCDNGTTAKSLWRLHDGALVESVLMRYTDRATVCISSQAGCGMACPFCATGQGGLTRNLSVGEIVSQVQQAAADMAYGRIAGGVGRLSNVVFMGMGEPLANYNTILTAVKRMIEPAPTGLGISARGITVSTVGLVPRIRQLADEGIPVTLAVSLHAPDDELRNELVPVNNRWNVREVLDAAWYFARQTKRRVSIEYAMIRDINDQEWRGDRLGRILRGHLAHVNLIPLNPTPGSKWTASRPEDEAAFVAAIERHGVPVTVRDTRGREIDGACGQLAAKAD
ncbi:MAG: 23S rRNA (adenine(2503)-C(2))-methyltransferase RlmN [Candidatus Nanopelagicales bacterium]